MSLEVLCERCAVHGAARCGGGDAAAPEGRPARRKGPCEGGTRVWGTDERGVLRCVASWRAGWCSQCTAPAGARCGAEPTLNGAFDPCAGSGCEWMQGRRVPGCAGHARCGRRGCRGVACVSVAVMCCAGWAMCSCEAACVGAWHRGVARRKTRAARVPLRPWKPPRPPPAASAGQPTVCVCAPHSPAHSAGCAAREAGAGSVVA